MATGSQRSKIDQNYPQIPFRLGILIRFGQNVAGTHYLTIKQACGQIFHLSQYPRWLLAVEHKKSAKIDPINHISTGHLDILHPIWSRFGKVIPLDPRRKPMDENFIFFKFKMTAAIMENYEMDIIWKLNKLETQFFLDPCFQGSGMHWSYHFHSTITCTVTTTKFKMAAIWVDFWCAYNTRMTIGLLEQIRCVGTICRAEMSLHHFLKNILTPGGHLGFEKNQKLLLRLVSLGQVVCSCQFLSKSDERHPFLESTCCFLAK